MISMTHPESVCILPILHKAESEHGLLSSHAQAASSHRAQSGSQARAPLKMVASSSFSQATNMQTKIQITKFPKYYSKIGKVWILTWAGHIIIAVGQKPQQPQPEHFCLWD